MQLVIRTPSEMSFMITFRNLFVLMAMLCGTMVLCVWLHANTVRYRMIPAGDKAYRYDQITGEIWLVNGSSYGPVEGPVNWAK